MHEQENEEDPTSIGSTEEECSDVTVLRDKLWRAKRSAVLLPDHQPSRPVAESTRLLVEKEIQMIKRHIPIAKRKCQEMADEWAALDREKERVAKLPGARIGMTRKQVLDKTHWGRPGSVNTTTTAKGTFEQWVYGDNQYLYFTNGKLTVIQD